MNLLILAAEKTQRFQFDPCNKLRRKEQSGVWTQASVFISFTFHLQADKYKRVKSSESGTL